MVAQLATKAFNSAFILLRPDIAKYHQSGATTFGCVQLQNGRRPCDVAQSYSSSGHTTVDAYCYPNPSVTECSSALRNK